ncbi:helix-turn-helix domain-containing protein [Paenibacillus tarimensis]
MMMKENKTEAIRLLDKKGAFLIKKAGEKICGYLNISKFTLYNYLEESREE